MAVKVEVVNLFLWKQLEPEHLALAPLGSLPVLVLAPGRALVGRVRLQLRTSWFLTLGSLVLGHRYPSLVL